ncbi:MAG: protein kinase domain-containing protein, partial [Pirellula sp.]
MHRDIKPANILVEASTRNAFVVDFGLATREFEYLQRSDGAGSPAYKSPEQIRREGHKLDGRSDLFSLGIVFYELLTGKRPFVGSTISETENRILYAEPIPPNDHKSDIPAELERICMKLLRKEPNERHSSGAQVAEELRDWLAPKTIATPASTDEPAKVIPRGLRSYSDEDAGFFLDLLPGERDRQGLPESVAFWKKKIEQRDPEKTFGLGMLIGPSGSGKSSLVKAGIVPRLPSKIVSIHLDATAEDTEERLLQSLKKRFSGLQEVSTLTEAFLWIRTRIEPKVVLWLDQFEQWLSSGFDLKHSDLVDALRQCDGRTLQAVLMVRDDFYMASDRLMDALDVRLIKGENFMTVDLFDQEHAVKVLFTFGKAYGRIPSETEFPPSGDLKAFIDSAVGGLAEGGKVVSVRLALFAQMVKDKVWEPQTLEAFGGAQGVGVNFLEESFSARDANPQHRFHAAGAKEVLKALLPVAVSDLKGHRRSASELCEVAGYTSKPAEFQSLVKILDDDLRLITPSDEQGFEGVVSQRSYQLTHDYLVPSLREWLTRKQRETKKGRAELKLAERAATWGAKRENKQLPTLWEWVQIRRWTDPVKWNATERAAMQASDRYHTTRALLASTLAMALVLSGLGFKLWNDQRFMERDAANLVSKIETADFGKLADELKKLPAMRAIVDPKLKAALEHTKDDSEEHLKLSLALVPSDPTQIDYLVRRLQSAQASQVQLIVDQLRPYKYKILDSLWSAIEGDNKAAWLPVAGALADYDPGNERWQSVAAKVSDNLVRDPLRLSIWLDLLRPAASKLNPELKRIYAATPDANRSQAQIDLATDILESY